MLLLLLLYALGAYLVHDEGPIAALGWPILALTGIAVDLAVWIHDA